MNSTKDERPGPFTLDHESAIKRGWFASCLNCEAFNKETELCILANQRPPAQVIVFGCSEWYIEIPF